MNLLVQYIIEWPKDVSLNGKRQAKWEMQVKFENKKKENALRNYVVWLVYYSYPSNSRACAKVQTNPRKMLDKECCGNWSWCTNELHPSVYTEIVEWKVRKIIAYTILGICTNIYTDFVQILGKWKCVQRVRTERFIRSQGKDFLSPVVSIAHLLNNSSKHILPDSKAQPKEYIPAIATLKATLPKSLTTLTRHPRSEWERENLQAQNFTN